MSRFCLFRIRCRWIETFSDKYLKQEEGNLIQMQRRLFTAKFGSGKSVKDRSTLCNIGNDAGKNPWVVKMLFLLELK